MKEQKSDKPARLPTGAPRKPPRSDSKMQTETSIRGPHGRLSRDVQRKLGETLQLMFDEIVKEGVPDRFSKLLAQIEAGQRGVPTGESAEPLTESSELDATGSRREPPPAESGDKGSS